MMIYICFFYSNFHGFWRWRFASFHLSCMSCLLCLCWAVSTTPKPASQTSLSLQGKWPVAYFSTSSPFILVSVWVHGLAFFSADEQASGGWCKHTKKLYRWVPYFLPTKVFYPFRVQRNNISNTKQYPLYQTQGIRNIIFYIEAL